MASPTRSAGSGLPSSAHVDRAAQSSGAYPSARPCRALGPVVEQVADEMSDQLALYKCNVDDEGDLAQRFQIVSIPTMILFKGGKPVHTMVGNMPKAELVKELQANL